jgi:lipoyl(octanoyl) transferase
MKTKSLGVVGYLPTWQAMRDFTQNRTPDTEDEVWCLQHPPVFTQGQAGKPEHILLAGDIPVVETDRGGQVTYHGPGQLVVYPLVDIERRGLGVRAWVSVVEASIIDTLDHYGLTAYADREAPGVYVDVAGIRHKVASLGMRIRQGRSYHGLALNVDMDLTPFSRINPCGYQGLAMIDLRRLLGQPVELEGVQKVWLADFQRLLD